MAGAAAGDTSRGSSRAWPRSALITDRLETGLVGAALELAALRALLAAAELAVRDAFSTTGPGFSVGPSTSSTLNRRPWASW